MAGGAKLQDEDYELVHEFRTAIRRFLKYSKTQAEEVGLTPAQHQLLLAVRGHRDAYPTIGDIAELLLIRHHSAVELIDRAERAGLIERRRDPNDQRVVRLALSRSGASKLQRVSEANLLEIRRLGREFRDVWTTLERLSDR